MKNMDHKQAAQMLWEAEQGRYQIDIPTLVRPIFMPTTRSPAGGRRGTGGGHEDRPDQRGNAAVAPCA